MMINDGSKRLVVVAGGVSVISYDAVSSAVYQQLTRSSTQLESKMKDFVHFRFVLGCFEA